MIVSLEELLINFVAIRASVLKLGGIESFAEVIGSRKTTIYSACKNWNESGVRSDAARTRQKIASGLKLPTWGDLIDAWRSDDVYRGLPGFTGVALEPNTDHASETDPVPETLKLPPPELAHFNADEREMLRSCRNRDDLREVLVAILARLPAPQARAAKKTK